MTIHGKNFEIVDDIHDDDDSVSGHETIVYRRRGADMDFVQKYPKYSDDHRQWMKNKKQVREITNQLRAKNNPAYRVPKTYITHGNVYEEFAHGETLENGPYDWRGKKRDFMIPAIAHLLNDMSEMHPIKYEHDGTVHGVWWLKNVGDLTRGLASMKFFTDADIKTMAAAFKYLADTPENSEMIFSHNDLNDGNVIVDDDTGVVSFIDFELAGYKSKLEIVTELNSYASYYENGMAPMWDFLQKLPREKNPNLNWNIREHVLDVYNIFRGICMYIRWGSKHYDTKRIEYLVGQIQKLRIAVGRARVADLNSKKQTAPTTIVPLSHYQPREK